MAPTTRTKVSHPTQTSIQTGIQRFGCISKTIQPDPLNKHDAPTTNISKNVKGVDHATPESSRKRKRDSSRPSQTSSLPKESKDNELVIVEDVVIQEYNTLEAQNSRKTIPSQDSPCSQWPLTPEHTPVKRARRRSVSAQPGIDHLIPHERFTPPPSPVFKAIKKLPQQTTKINDGERVENFIEACPPELQDLIQLHSSFLKALSIHLAHSGPASPLDVRSLTLTATKIWGKRRVVLADLRRSLGLVTTGTAPLPPSMTSQDFRFCDYGRGKICLEFLSTKSSDMFRYIDESQLNDIFVKALETVWSQRQDAGRVNDDTESRKEVESFIEGLPQAIVTPCSALKKVKPLFAEGQRRLEDLKSGAIKAQNQTSKFVDIRDARKSTTAIKNRGQDLLERLKAKAESQSLQPAPLSKAALERQAALQRLEEIVTFFPLPRSNATRSSSSLAKLVQDIQNSSRNPLSREEIERCLSLMSEEIAPDFVTILKENSIAGVVIDHRYKPSDLAARLRRAACA